MIVRFEPTLHAQARQRIRFAAALVGSLVILTAATPALAHVADLRSQAPTSSLAGTSGQSQYLRSQAPTSSLAGTSGQAQYLRSQAPTSSLAGTTGNTAAQNPAPDGDNANPWTTIVLGVLGVLAIAGSVTLARARLRARRPHVTA